MNSKEIPFQVSEQIKNTGSIQKLSLEQEGGLFALITW
jgi:hypothetical protein